MPSTATLRVLPDKGVTISTWLRIEAAQSDAYVLELADANRALVLGVDGTQAFVRLQTGRAGRRECAVGGRARRREWHHLAVTAGDGRMKLFVDGVEVAATPAELAEIAGRLMIGASAAGGQWLDRRARRSAGLEHRAQPPIGCRPRRAAKAQEAPLVVYGSDAQKEGGEVSYFAVTMHNVTVDGWVVIVILAVMFVIALLVIVSKAVFLARVQKANREFLKEFERLRGDPDRARQAESRGCAGRCSARRVAVHAARRRAGRQIRVSTIYRLYHHGVQEMTGRIGLDVGRRARGQDVHAAGDRRDPGRRWMRRSCADAEARARMVLLTIAISGGPFLGLLGTVVGVMITFAAIAASGDVNVNAIAPGIAAALAATVAGLGVAIPALFGYNWLNTRIKEINADMHVFVDEFVTRVAEHYRDARPR